MFNDIIQKKRRINCYIKIVKHTGVFHFWPYCCAEKIKSNNKFKKTNWLWLFWMFCFD